MGGNRQEDDIVKQTKWDDRGVRYRAHGKSADGSRLRGYWDNVYLDHSAETSGGAIYWSRNQSGSSSKPSRIGD